MQKLSGLAAILFASTCYGYGDAYHGEDLYRVSLISLIATPEKYHNKKVRVIGAGRLEFEGNAICLSKDDLVYGISRNCLWTNVDPESIRSTKEKLEEFNDKYVLIEGVFNSENTGHMGMNSGGIENINRYDLWERSRP